MCLLNVFSVECILILGSCVSAPRRPQGETAQVVLDIKDSFKKFDVRGDGSLNANEFEEWFVSGGRGDARQAKAAFRDVDRSPSLKKKLYILGRGDSRRARAALREVDRSRNSQKESI
jgi:hypothetical protein